MNRLTCSFVAFLSLSTTGLFTHREQEGNPHYKRRQGHGEPPRQSAGSPSACTRQRVNSRNSAPPTLFCSGHINKHFTPVFSIPAIQKSACGRDLEQFELCSFHLPNNRRSYLPPNGKLLIRTNHTTENKNPEPPRFVLVSAAGGLHWKVLLYLHINMNNISIPS